MQDLSSSLISFTFFFFFSEARSLSPVGALCVKSGARGIVLMEMYKFHAPAVWYTIMFGQHTLLSIACLIQDHRKLVQCNLESRASMISSQNVRNLNNIIRCGENFSYMASFFCLFFFKVSIPTDGFSVIWRIRLCALQFTTVIVRRLRHIHIEKTVLLQMDLTEIGRAMSNNCYSYTFETNGCFSS